MPAFSLFFPSNSTVAVDKVLEEIRYTVVKMTGVTKPHIGFGKETTPNTLHILLPAELQ